MQRRNPQGGQATVEAAFALLVFFPVLFAIIEFGHLIYTYNYVHYMARDATRYASVRGSTASQPATADTIRTYVRDQAIAMDPLQLTVTTTFPDGGNTPGDAVRVLVSYPFPGLVSWVLPASTTVTSASQMIILQ